MWEGFESNLDSRLHHDIPADNSKSIIESVEKSVKYVQRYQNDIIDIVLMFLVIPLNVFHTFFYYCYC